MKFMYFFKIGKTDVPSLKQHIMNGPLGIITLWTQIILWIFKAENLFTISIFLSQF